MSPIPRFGTLLTATFAVALLAGCAADSGPLASDQATLRFDLGVDTSLSCSEAVDNLRAHLDDLEEAGVQTRRINAFRDVLDQVEAGDPRAPRALRSAEKRAIKWGIYSEQMRDMIQDIVYACDLR